MSNRFATTGGTIMGITGTTGVMVGTTPDLPLLERLSVYWERPRRVLRPATPMVTISPMAMGAGSAARPRREFAIAHVPCGSRPSVSRNGFWQVMPSCAKSRPTDTRLKMIWNLSLIYAARNQTVGALRNPKRRATFFKDMLSLRRGRPTPKSPPPSPPGSPGVSSPSPEIGRVASPTRSFLQRRDGRRSKALMERAECINVPA